MTAAPLKRTAPPFDQSVEMIEAIRASVVRLTREKLLSPNRQAKELGNFARRLDALGILDGQPAFSQQMWGNFAKTGSRHLPSNRRTLEVAWFWLHELHHKIIAEEIRLRKQPHPIIDASGHPSHSRLNFLADVMVSHARPHFTGDLTGSHALLLAHPETGFEAIDVMIAPYEQGSDVRFSLRRRTIAGQITTHGYQGSIVPHLYGLMIVASGPRGRDPAIILLRDARVEQSPPGYAFCGSITTVQNEEECTTQPCIFLPYVECFEVDHAELSEEISRMTGTSRLIAEVLGKAPIVI